MRGLVSAIVIHYGSLAYTEHVVRQLAGFSGGPEREVIVVDNAAVPPFPADAWPNIRTVRIDENRGYGHACNRGADAARGDYLFILNNDLHFDGDPLPGLLAGLDAHPDAAVAGPGLRFRDGRFQLSYGENPSLRSEFLERRRQRQSRGGGGGALEARERASQTVRPVDWITGACMLFRAAAYRRVGGFDEAYFFYFEDADICRRLRRAGGRVLYLPAVQVVHYGGGSDPQSDPRIIAGYRREQLRYYARYNGALSFQLLRLYLRLKFRGGDGEADRQVRETIRTFSRSEERKRFSESARDLP